MFPGGQVAGGKIREFRRARGAGARLRQYFLRRNSRGSSCLPVDHGPSGDGLRHRRNGERWNGRFQWCRLTITIVSIALLVCIGCQRKAQATSDQIYDQIEREFVSGDLSKARSHSEETYRRMEANQPELAVPFRIELAKILIYQGKSS